MPAELRAKIAVDTSDLDRSSVKVRDFERTLTGAFKRDPGQRAEMAIEQMTRSLASGNIGGAIEGITSRLDIFGIAGGAAFAVVGAGIASAITSASEFHKVVEESGRALARLPGEGASLEALKEGFKSISEAQAKIAPALQGWFRLSADIANMEQQKVQWSDEYAKNLDMQIDKQREQAQIMELSISGAKAEVEARKAAMAVTERHEVIDREYNKEREEINKRGLPIQQEAQQEAALHAAMTRAHEDLDLTSRRAAQLRELAPLRERSLLTTKEIEGGLGSREDRALLQLSEKAEAMGEKFRQKGPAWAGLAAEKFKEADIWKSQMAGLKEAEKPDLAMKSAIHSAQVFQSMLQELNMISKGVNQIEL